jgi:hypothetical protein
MPGANLRGEVVDEGPLAIGIHDFGDLAELLQPGKDRLSAVADRDQSVDVSRHPLGRDPIRRLLNQR